jgi:outer membrane cobalamin receptor
VARENLARVEVVQGGGATAWGHAALGGVVQILTQQPSVQTTGANATFGDFGTRSAEMVHTQPGVLGTFDLGAQVFATDGFALVAPERRGPIDVAAWSRHTLLNLRWRQPLGDNCPGAPPSVALQSNAAMAHPTSTTARANAPSP